MYSDEQMQGKNKTIHRQLRDIRCVQPITIYLSFKGRCGTDYCTLWWMEKLGFQLDAYLEVKDSFDFLFG